MMNYSIAMRPVNANLLEINQAKARIKAARAEGKSPAAADEALVKTEVKKAFATAQLTEVVNIEKFARHITSHGSVYSRADIAAILYMAVDCMRELLLDGKKIRLGDLGDFSVSLSSTGAESAEKFTAQNITAVKVNWDCGDSFKNLLPDAEFNLVASRSAQNAVIKAIKAGEKSVDLEAVNGAGGSASAGGSSAGGNTSGSGSSTSGSGSSTGGSTSEGDDDREF